MSDKFNNVPVEEDTVILLQEQAQLGELDTLYQKWEWSGIAAESLVFSNQDVGDIHEEALRQEVSESPLVNEGSQITVKRSDDFTFVNFNFVTED